MHVTFGARKMPINRVLEVRKEFGISVARFAEIFGSDRPTNADCLWFAQTACSYMVKRLEGAGVNVKCAHTTKDRAMVQAAQRAVAGKAWAKLCKRYRLQFATMPTLYEVASHGLIFPEHASQASKMLDQLAAEVPEELESENNNSEVQDAMDEAPMLVPPSEVNDLSLRPETDGITMRDVAPAEAAFHDRIDELVEAEVQRRLAQHPCPDCALHREDLKSLHTAMGKMLGTDA